MPAPLAAARAGLEWLLRSCEELRELALARGSSHRPQWALCAPPEKLNPITGTVQKHPPRQPGGIAASAARRNLLYEVLFCFSKRQKPPGDAAAVPAFKYFGDVLASIPERALGKHQQSTRKAQNRLGWKRALRSPNPSCARSPVQSPESRTPQTSPGSPFQCPVSLSMWEFLPNSPGPARGRALPSHCWIRA